MRTIVALVAFALPSAAGVVQGVVVEQVSGLPLSRTVVRLDPVPGASADAKPFSMRSGRGGQFTFVSVPAGVYLLKAQRTGYFSAAHGQRRPTGAATPIIVSKDSDFFSTLAMRRLGAISGRVLDENGVGMPGIPVVAYRNQRPLAIAGRGTSDDRGVYRIPGLLPGRYWVRTGPATLDDGSGRLPAFAPESREPRDAKTYRVDLHADAPDGDVRPETGNLVRITGKIQCPQLAGVVLVTLASETGHRTTETGCNAPYAFEGVAPGPYEIFAAVRDLPQSGYIERVIDRDIDLPVRVDYNPAVQFELYKAGSTEAPQIPVALYGRRRDLSETAVDLQLEMPRSTLAPGPWEMSATVGAGYYVESIGSPYFGARRPARAEPSLDRHDVLVDNRSQSRIRIAVSDKVGQIEGTVVEQSKPVAAIPVFLWSADPANRRSLRGVPQALTTVDGSSASRTCRPATTACSLPSMCPKWMRRSSRPPAPSVSGSRQVYA